MIIVEMDLLEVTAINSPAITNETEQAKATAPSYDGQIAVSCFRSACMCADRSPPLGQQDHVGSYQYQECGHSDQAALLG